MAQMHHTGRHGLRPVRTKIGQLETTNAELLAILTALERRAFDAAVNSIPEAHVTLRRELEMLCFQARSAIAKAAE